MAAARNWMEAVVARLLKIVRSDTGDEVSRESAALSEAEGQLDAARKDLVQAQADRTDAMRSALDGDVDAGTLDRHRANIARARARVEELEQLVRVLQERQARAEQNMIARDIADRWVQVRRYVDAINAGMRKILTGIALIAEGAREVRLASAAAESIAPVKPTTWPLLWGPRTLEIEILMQLERENPQIFRRYGSVVQSRASLEAQHKAAVADVMPPNPAPHPAAA